MCLNVAFGLVRVCQELCDRPLKAGDAVSYCGRAAAASGSRTAGSYRRISPVTEWKNEKLDLCHRPEDKHVKIHGM